MQATWLLTLAGVEATPPKEFDDPNSTCASLLAGCKKLGFAAPSYHPAKLTVRARVCAPGVNKGALSSMCEMHVKC